MRLFSVLKTYRSLGRLREIVVVFSRHGLGHLVDRLGLAHYVPFLSRIRRPSVPVELVSREESLARRIRLVCQELGPTFIKLGQVLSGRPDLVPEEFLHELERLQDQVEPFGPETARAILEEELGKDPKAVFESFDEVALASGSIGQAHRAVLPDGTEVILKLRRPGIERTILTDLYILEYLAELAERYLPEVRVYRPAMIVEELGRTLRKEIDFLSEAAHTSKFQKMFAEWPLVTAPRVYWDLTTSRLLVLERLSGGSIGDRQLIENCALEGAKVAANLARAFMHQYFSRGLFHADPHPGNILVAPDGQIGLIDFGMVGVLSDDLRRNLGSIVLALVSGDIRRILEVAVKIGVIDDQAPLDQIEPDLAEYVEKFFTVPLDRIESHLLFTDLMRIVQRHHIYVPRDFVLLGKSLVTVISVCQSLDPKFRLSDAARPYVTRILLERLSPWNWFRATSRTVRSVLSPLSELPRELTTFLRRMNRRDLTVNVKDEQLDSLNRTVARASNRLGLSIVLAALLVSTTLYFRALGETPLSWAGVIAIGLVGLALGFGILRSGHV